MQPQSMSEAEGLDLCYCFAGTADSSYNYDFPAYHQSLCNPSFYSLDVMSDITDCNPEAKALAASQQHKEAERRRRERINSHLDRLRTLLPCNSKTDKASLLAKVVQRVRELKQQTSETMQLENFPSESDEISVMSSIDNSGDGRLLIKASLCCEDRSDLMPDLIAILKSQNLSPLRAEMVSLGGRIKNVIILAGDKDHSDDSVPSLRNALKSLIQRPNYGPGDRPKRRRVFDQGIVN